jgi:hypothetical protein
LAELVGASASLITQRYQADSRAGKLAMDGVGQGCFRVGGYEAAFFAAVFD